MEIIQKSEAFAADGDDITFNHTKLIFRMEILRRPASSATGF
jgi:hypothetical protein